MARYDTHIMGYENTRKIELSGIQNARELGGLITADGRAIRDGTLIRSAELAKATTEDLKKLNAEHRLDLVIDLRTDGETERRPDRRMEGIEYRPLPVITEKLIGLTHEDDADGDTGNVPYPPMDRFYRLVAVNEECRDRLRDVLNVITGHDYSKGSVLWHCTEGKDRCGMVTALVLTMLGVSREDIMEDYLLTNEVNVPKAEELYRYIMADSGDELLAESVKQAYLADRSYLEAAFAAMEEMCGSPYAYVTDRLGISEEQIERFRNQVCD